MQMADVQVQAKANLSMPKPERDSKTILILQQSMHVVDEREVVSVVSTDCGKRSMMEFRIHQRELMLLYE
jgi:hypothetical protein